MMQILPFLLLGCLSMLFAEVFSGASQDWFLDSWGVFLTFPLYLGHVVFFLWIALHFKRISFSSLYFLGVIFALYESWITKVLWAGYMQDTSETPILLGIKILEFLILVFFWHPIMSFLLPLLVFEILNKNICKEHSSLLIKTKKKMRILFASLLAISAFIANGNAFDPFSINLSLIGTLAIIMGLFFLSQKTSLQIFEFQKRGFIILSLSLFLLYCLSFFFLLPERIPTTLLPYISILVSYSIAIFLFVESRPAEIGFFPTDECHYSLRDMVIFSGVVIFWANIWGFFPQIGQIVLLFTYFFLMLFGVFLFVRTASRTLRRKASLPFS